MEEAEFFSFLEKRDGLLDGVAVTGGEPCLHRELPDFLRKVKKLGFLTKVDTNGYHPLLLAEILREHLADYVAMDIKNSPEKYAVTAGVGQAELPRIRESIALIMNSGTDYEFRTTVVEQLHEAADFEKMGEMIAGAKRYFLQSFMDRDSVPFEGLSAPDEETIQHYAEIARFFVQDVQIRGR